MEEHMTEGVPEGIEQLVRQAVENVIGALEGFRDCFKGFVKLREVILTTPELASAYSEPVLSAIRDADESELLGLVTRMESAIEALEELKSPGCLAIFNMASTRLTDAIGLTALGMAKLRRFLAGGSTL